MSAAFSWRAGESYLYTRVTRYSQAAAVAAKWVVAVLLMMMQGAPWEEMWTRLQTEDNMVAVVPTGLMIIQAHHPHLQPQTLHPCSVTGS